MRYAAHTQIWNFGREWQAATVISQLLGWSIDRHPVVVDRTALSQSNPILELTYVLGEGFGLLGFWATQ